jgi:hypothetical protein
MFPPVENAKRQGVFIWLNNFHRGTIQYDTEDSILEGIFLTAKCLSSIWQCSPIYKSECFSHLKALTDKVYTFL